MMSSNVRFGLLKDTSSPDELACSAYREFSRCVVRLDDLWMRFQIATHRSLCTWNGAAQEIGALPLQPLLQIAGNNAKAGHTIAIGCSVCPALRFSP